MTMTKVTIFIMKTTSKEFISLKELSIKLGKSESSIRYHIRRGRIKPAFKLGRSYSFDLENVMKQLQQSIKHY